MEPCWSCLFKHIVGTFRKPLDLDLGFTLVLATSSCPEPSDRMKIYLQIPVWTPQWPFSNERISQHSAKLCKFVKTEELLIFNQRKHNMMKSKVEAVALHTSSTSRLENCAPSFVCKSEKITPANPKTHGLQILAWIYATTNYQTHTRSIKRSWMQWLSYKIASNLSFTEIC